MHVTWCPADLDIISAGLNAADFNDVPDEDLKTGGAPPPLLELTDRASLDRGIPYRNKRYKCQTGFDTASKLLRVL